MFCFFPCPIPQYSNFDHESFLDIQAEDAERTKAELYIQDYLRSPLTNLIWVIPVFCFSILLVSLWPVIRDLFFFTEIH